VPRLDIQYGGSENQSNERTSLTDAGRNGGAKFRKKEWQRFGNQIDAEMIFAQADSVSVLFLRDKIEESRLKYLWQQTAGTHRCGEAVSGGRADS
jgi:hypothetical protein